MTQTPFKFDFKRRNMLVDRIDVDGINGYIQLLQQLLNYTLEKQGNPIDSEELTGKIRATLPGLTDLLKEAKNDINQISETINALP